MQSKLQLACKAIMEASWLAAAAVIPLFFNISSFRIFEFEKICVLRLLVVVSVSAWLLARIGAGRRGMASQFRSFMRNPLVKPVLALGMIYLLSSIFSIAPVESWWGLNKRAQGTVAFFCYVILFLTVLSELRTGAQAKRLQFVFILTSIPVSAYSILQYFRIDPVPSGVLILGRSWGSMGNAIFLGGYLVMLIPPTFCQLLERFRGLDNAGHRNSGIVPISCYSLALLLQCTALVTTQSRGPLLGLAISAYICLFIFLVMNRTKQRDRPALHAAAAGLGLVAPALVIAIARFGAGRSAGIALACIAAAAALTAVVYLCVWLTPWGRGRLWLTWITQSLALVLLLAYPAGSARSLFSLAPSLGHLGSLSDTSYDTSISIRSSLWKTAIHFVRSGSPAILPDGTRDRYHFLRSAIGYGPECVWLAANTYADPSLARLSPDETADRMHNETFDNLVTIGSAGSAAFLLLIAAAFYHALRYLGFISENGGKAAFILLSGLGSLAGFFGPWAAGAPLFIGVGIEIGLLAGLFLFVAWSGFRNPDSGLEVKTRPLFVLGILGALIAHFIEIAVGIAVTPTRVYFYLLLAILAVLCNRDLADQEEPAKKRAAGSERWFRNPWLPYASLSGIVVLLESWCFMFNPENERSATALFLRTWFGAGAADQNRLGIPGAAVILLLTTCGGIGLIYSERSGGQIHQPDFRKALKIFLVFVAAVWITMGMLSAAFWTALVNPSSLDVLHHAEGRMLIFVGGLLLLLMATALLMLPVWKTIKPAAPRMKASVVLLSILLSVGAILGIWELTIQPLWADMASRIASAYEETGNPAAAAQMCERASRLAPGVIQYRLSLGIAQGTAGISDPAQLKQAFLSLRSALDINRLDPTIYMALGTLHMQVGERSADPDTRTAEIKSALSDFQKVSRLAPTHLDAYSQTGRCLFLLGDYEQANTVYQKSLRLNPNYSPTYMVLGEMHYQQRDLEQALRDFTDAARLDGGNIEALKNMGLLLALLGRREEAIRIYTDTLNKVPGDAVLLTRIAILHFSLGDYNAGIAFARQAYDATPAAAKSSLDDFIEKLKNQAN
jgi:tetratricopeptide (TPR) repeat protein